VSNSRGPETLAGVVDELGPAARALTATEAAAYGELVVVAIPLGRYRELSPEPYAGKIVVDADNYYPQRDGQIAELDEGKLTSTELLAAHLPGARVLKAFNTIHWRHLRDLGDPTAAVADRRAVPVAGDDAAARAVLTGLIEQVGFAVADTGSLAESWRQEPDTPVYGAEVGPDEAATLIARATR
jgi:predicted dinucleotide-binding enzyme